MSDNQRYRSGPFSEVKSAVKAGVLAEIGDLVALNAGLVETPTSLNTTIALFADKFLGVLVQGATRGTETANTPCLVYTSGEFEYPLASAAGAVLPIGTLVSLSGGTTDQVVNATGVVIADAIGRLAKAIAVGDTTCLVKIESVIFGGAQAAS